MLDDEGNEWARFAIDKREPIALKNMPAHLINAFIAAEDRNFFNHSGISIRGIVRSILVNLYHRKRMQGASTITQQLIRLLYFNAQKTFRRKVQEQLMALIVERQFTKEQILETYLNHICFGCGIYGVQAAAQRFWGIDAQDITPMQAATLAAIVRNPNYYCPLLHEDHTLTRRNIILHLMHTQGFLSEQEYQEAKMQDINLVRQNNNCIAPHFKETIRQEIEKLVGREQLYYGGLTIQTTLSCQIQKAAHAAFQEQVALLKNNIHEEIDGGLITLEVQSGAIKAMIGGFQSTSDNNYSHFNRATQARRQLGSGIKPIIYACAIAHGGAQFDDIEIDEPIVVKPHNKNWEPLNSNEKFNGPNKNWEPRNSNRRFEGPMTLANALSRSNNIIAIKTLLQHGIENTINLARAMGITEPMPAYPSLALGCIDVTLLQVTGTFNTFANNGTYIKPYCIKWIKNEWGTKIWHYQEKKQVAIEQKISNQVTQVLSLSIARICSLLGITLDFQAFYKTGTTNDSRNCWILGSTPQYTTGIYLGADNYKSLGENIFAIRTTFPMWYQLNKEIGSRPHKFSYDPRLKEIIIDAYSGKPTRATNKNAIKILVDR